MIGLGCPVAIHVKLWDWPEGITDVTGRVIIFGTSKNKSSVFNSNSMK